MPSKIQKWLQDHPAAVIVSIVVATSAVWAGIYIPLHALIVENKDSVNESLRERIDILEERLVRKDELLAKHRERLDDLKLTQTSFARLTNRELKSTVNETLAGLRGFLHEQKQRDDSIIQNIRNSAPADYASQIQQAYSDFNRFYSERFKNRLVLLRDELITRLPAQKVPPSADYLYEKPLNLLGLQQTIDHLERLAFLLPEQDHTDGSA